MRTGPLTLGRAGSLPDLTDEHLDALRVMWRDLLSHGYPNQATNAQLLTAAVALWIDPNRREDVPPSRLFSLNDVGRLGSAIRYLVTTTPAQVVLIEDLSKRIFEALTADGAR